MIGDIFMDKRSRFHPVFSNHSKNFGFTLIILLLLLAVVGVMISYRVITLQQKEQESKIEKAALQIEGILEAGKTYYKDKNHWPNPERLLEDFTPYLPLGKFIPNPWGGTYTVSIVDGDFQVSTDVLREDVAKSIAALLPNASVAKDATSKIVTRIASDLNLNPGEIVMRSPLVKTWNADDFNHEGVVKSDDYFGCPWGMEGHLMVIPQSFTIGSKTDVAKNYPTPNIKKIGLDMDGSGLPDCEKTDIPEFNSFACTYSFFFQAQVCADPGNIRGGCNAHLDKLSGPIDKLLQKNGSVTLLLIEYCQSKSK